MSEMVERVARALLNERGMRHGIPSVTNVEAIVGAKLWDEAKDEARAVLEAMREPTEKMEQAFHASCDGCGRVLWRTGYRVMIDEALR